MKIVKNSGFIVYLFLGGLLLTGMIILFDALDFDPRPGPGDPTYIEVSYIAEDELNELIDKSASRKEIIDRFGRPLRYREHEVSYETCEKEPVLVCNEVILEFDAQDVISGFRKIPKQPQLNQNTEDMNLRKLGKEGDSIAQKLWVQSKTYYTSEQKDIVEERKENERKRIIKEKKLEAELKKRADTGDPEAQFGLYMFGDKTDLKWLCRSADQGYTKAEMWIGYVLETGTYGFTLDYTQSYVWYRRAAIGEHQQEIDKTIKKINEEAPKLYLCKGTSCDIAQKIVDLEGRLSTEKRSTAKHKLEQWVPGECERFFVDTKTNN